jgi:YD repeat-containing protein
MKKISIILMLTLFNVHAVSQTSILSVLRLTQEREYKTKLPRKIVETNIFYYSSGKQIEKNTKTFDDTGMLIFEERRDEIGNLQTQLTYVIDTINRRKLSRTIERWYGWSGYSKETAYFSYDDHNFLVRWTDVDANGKTRYVSFILCNTNGDPIEILLFDGNGNSYGKETAIYDYNRNEVITNVLSNKSIVLSKVTTTIDFSKAYLFNKHGCIYNEQGDIIKSVDATGKIGYSYEYTYDIYGNCIEQKIYKITIRKNGKEKRRIDRIFRKEYTY